jgi:hypothetical protein
MNKAFHCDECGRNCQMLRWGTILGHMRLVSFTRPLSPEADLEPQLSPITHLSIFIERHFACPGMADSLVKYWTW